ncbi:hypothetical protein HN51_012838 [Arachis hypogaea]
MGVQWVYQTPTTISFCTSTVIFKRSRIFARGILISDSYLILPVSSSTCIQLSHIVYWYTSSVIISGVPAATQVSQIPGEPTYSLEEDLLNHSIYKPISELKDSIENGSLSLLARLYPLILRMGGGTRVASIASILYKKPRTHTTVLGVRHTHRLTLQGLA